MSRRVLLLLVVLGLLGVVIPGAAGVSVAGRTGLRSSVQTTQVIRWSPFTNAGTVKRSLHVNTYAGGCDSGSTSRKVGGVAYHCAVKLGRNDYLIDPCWRDGPGQARAVICVDSPWTRSAYRLRVPRLMIDNGVTFAGPFQEPWAITLSDDNHCVLLSGAVDVFATPKGRMGAAYRCAKNVVLAGDLRRGRGLWRVTAVRWTGAGYVYLGDATVRQVFVGALPRGMARQNRLAASAARVAERVIRQSQDHVFGKRNYLVAIHRVRLALPDANWAQLYAWVFWGSGDGERNASVVLHRVAGHWVTAATYRPYCLNLPATVRVQLFTAADCL